MHRTEIYLRQQAPAFRQIHGAPDACRLLQSGVRFRGIVCRKKDRKGTGFRRASEPVWRDFFEYAAISDSGKGAIGYGLSGTDCSQWNTKSVRRIVFETGNHSCGSVRTNLCGYRQKIRFPDWRMGLRDAWEAGGGRTSEAVPWFSAQSSERPALCGACLYDGDSSC